MRSLHIAGMPGTDAPATAREHRPMRSLHIAGMPGTDAPATAREH